MAPESSSPTLSSFFPRYLLERCTAERQRPSTIAFKRQVMAAYLAPALGDVRLADIDDARVRRLKAALARLSPKTVNNVLAVLRSILVAAHEWGTVDDVPTVRLLRCHPPDAAFYDFDVYRRLVVGAHAVSPEAAVAVLLGGDAGMRRGEVIALEWRHVSSVRRTIAVVASSWRGHLTPPKSGRAREVPVSDALHDALARWRLASTSGRVVVTGVRALVSAAEGEARLPRTGRFHILRHTFCSHLAMLGAPARTIQELAGHADLSTTMRYMHLSDAARADAIGLLAHRPSSTSRS